MDMCDLLPISPACLASDAVGGVGSFAAGGILDSIGAAFASAAESVMNAVFDAISTTTTVDLTADYVTRNAAALGSVALVVIVGLFVAQVIAAAIRREPGGLARAVTGAGVATLGTAAAAAVVQALLIAVDGICDGIAGLAGTSIQDAARGLIDAALLAELASAGTGGAGGALLIVFGLLFILGAALTLGTLLVRQALIVIAVVVAPLALAGGAARITSGWVIRWVQVTLALVLSKLAIVIVFVVAIGMVGGTTGIGALLSGLILLLLASLAPWACFKILDFAGTHVAGEWHRSTNGSAMAVANQGRMSVQSVMRSVTAVVGGASAGPARRWVVYDEAWRVMRHPALIRRMQAQWKLSRAYGIANLMVIHRLSDLDAIGDLGSEVRALAQGLLADCSTRIIYRQEADQLAGSALALGLTETETELLPTLGVGQGLWRIRDRAFVAQHQLTRGELEVFDTAARMVGRS